MPNKSGGMSEDELLRTVIDLAHLHGWRVAHFRTALTTRGNWITPVQADGKGLVLVRGEMLHNDRLIFAELKSQKGHISPEQNEWLMALGECKGAYVYLWRPSDLPEIAEILR